MMATDRTSTSDDWLERALAADAAEHAAAYLADDGFTARVLVGLPRPATLPAWRRPVVVLLWLAVAVAGIAALPVWFDAAFRGAAALLVGHRLGLSDVAIILTTLGAATWSALIYVARAE
jgi:ferric-dicitrate binding protein FerR (iron transport regulator)